MLILGKVLNIIYFCSKLWYYKNVEPLHRFYGGSESLSTRLSATVAQKNCGYGYIAQVWLQWYPLLCCLLFQFFVIFLYS